MRERKKSVVALLLAVLLFSVFAVDWRAVADTALSRPEKPVQGAEEAQFFEAMPRVRRVGPAQGAGLFEVWLDVPPQAVSRAFLTYELAGVPHWTAAVRSINGMPRHGGFATDPSSGMNLQVEEINPAWLRPGVNQIVFYPSGDAEDGEALPYTVRNLRLVVSGQGVRPPSPRLTVTHPVKGEQGADGVQLRGFVEPALQPAGPAELFVNGSHMAGGIDLRDGAFAAFVPRTVGDDEPWEIEVEVVYPDGTRLRQKVRLPAAKPRDGEDEPGDDLAETDAGPGTAKSLALGKARLDVAADALAGKVRLTMRGLRHGDLPALDAGMTNVTPGQGGFRMGPHGLRFKKAIEVTLPYDATLIPRGMTAEDVQTFFFDEEAGRWVPLPRVEAKASADTITSLTDHFTDFINATLALPDEPAGASFSPNSIQELAKADPASGIYQIEPPEGGPMGDAMLDFPLVVPPGRLGMKPELAVEYNSSAANGWLGVGWDLRMSRIEILTSFGVPRYDGSERYLFDGEQLAATSDPSVFVRRVEGKFERIVRKGTGATDYWWEVTDKDGVRSVYGRSAASRLWDRCRTGNIFRWHLEQVIDPHGNTIDYTYTTDQSESCSGGGEPWVEVYPAAIAYTGGSGVAPFYQVRFVLDDGQQRPDRMSSGRQGFKTYMRRRLDQVDVLAGGDLVRRYLFRYREGDFRKSLLDSVAMTGEDGTTELYRHGFTYFSAETGFGAPVSWGSLSATESRAENQNISGGAHGFVGVGDTACAVHGGVQAGGNYGQGDTRATFLDLNGDGLPDRVSQEDGRGTVTLNRFNPELDSGGFSETLPLSRAAAFEQNQQWSFDLGLGLHAFGELANIGASWVWSNSNDDRAVADLNGDGLPDLVGSGSVLFNQGGSFGGPASLTAGGGSFDLAVPGQREQVLSIFKPAAPLRKLVLPYKGTVVITGGIRKKAAVGDGVGVEIHHNNGRIWRRAVAGDDLSVCVPAPGGGCGEGLALPVEKGDRLYFLADAGEGTAGDDLLWAPRVAYTSAVLVEQSEIVEDVGGRQEELEPYGARRFVFDAAADFRLAGFRGAGWTAPAGGSVRVLGSVDKRPTTSDVTLTIEKGDAVLATWSFAADQEGTFDLGLPDPVPVAAQESLRFRVRSVQPIDPALVQWSPVVTYEGGQYCRVPSGSTEPVCGALSCQVDPASGQRVCAVAGDPGAGTIPQDAVTRSPQALLDVFPALWNAPGEPLSGGYHGWFYGEWSGGQPFQESGLGEPAEGEKPSFVPAKPKPEGVTGVAGPVWDATGFDLYIAADGFKPSRQGMDAAGQLDQAEGPSGGGVGLIRKTSGTAVSVQGGAGPAGISISCGASDTQLDLLDLNGDLYPDQVSGDANLTTDLDSCVGLTGTGTGGDGDVRLADGRGGFSAVRTFEGLESPVRRSADGNLGLSAGLSVSYTRKDGKGSSKSVSSPTASVGSNLSYSQTTTDLVDVNGDGLPDRVSMAPGGSAVTVRLNLGYRFGAEEAWPLPAWRDASASCRNVANLGTGNLGDLTSFGTWNALRHSSSSAVNAGLAYGPFGGGVGTTLSRTLVDLVDVNGDDLPDHVARDHDGAFQVKINHGDHWGEEQSWTDPDWPGGPLDHHGGLFNCRDALSSAGDVNGNGSAGAPICIPLLFVGIQIEVSAQVGGAEGGAQIFLEDFNGDGLADRVLKGSDETVYLKPNKAQQSNLLVRVDRPLGGAIALEYKRQGNRVERAPDGRRIDMQANQWVLAATVLSDGRGHEYRTAYEYFNDGFYDRQERESYGYARVRATLPDGSTVDSSFHNQDFYRRYLKTREAVADRDGNLFQIKTWRYEPTPETGESRFPALVEETSSFYEGTARTAENPPKSTSQTYEYDSLGNVVRSVDFNDAGVTDDLAVTISYEHDPDTWITRAARLEARDGAGRLLRRSQGTFNATGDLTRLERTLLGGRDPETGAAYSGSRNPVWTFTYDGQGNLASSADPTGYTSTFTYEPQTRAWPVEVRDSFGYVTRYAYDLKYGELAETVDENGNSLRRTYDGFGRLSRIVGPYDSDGAPSLAFEYGPGNPVSWAVVHHRDVTRPDPIDTAVFTDALGRVLQTKEDAELDLGSGSSTRAGMRVSGRIEFDARGRVSSEGQPTFDNAPARDFVNVPAKNPTTVAYDVLDRVREVRFPHGAVTRIAYGFGTLDGVQRFQMTRTDPNNRETAFYSDVDGNTLGVGQTNTFGGVRKPIVTRYEYDALDQLLSVRDAKGATTRLEHDTLGRNVVLDNPDLGRTEFRHDPAGNLGAKITANLAALGQQIRYLYTFNRLDRIDYPSSPDVVLTYGAPGAPFNRANRVASVTDESGVEERSYNKLGEVAQTVKTTTALNGDTPKGPYTTRFEFDSFHRLLSVVYPDGETLSYGYDAGGKVRSASGVLRGVRFDYLRHLGYDEFGDRTRVVYGNGVESRYSYDPQSRFLAGLRTTGEGRDLQNLRYQNDLTGSIQAITNDVPVPASPLYGGPVTQTFQYDDLYQLVGARGTYRNAPNKTSTYTLALTYDEVGNTTAKNQLHQIASGGQPTTQRKTSYNWAYTYGGPQPHAPTRVGSRTFSYDLNGNQTGWQSDRNGTRRTLTWNEENRLASVSDNGQTTRFLYDAAGMRANKAGQHGETTYVNRWYSLRNGAIASKHVFTDGVRVSTKVSPDPNPSSEKVYFYQEDHLGSAHFITDDQGAVYQHLEYFASGEIWSDERSEAQRTPYLFSGKELDEETGLSYFGFRYYDARQGQWISADPILDEMLDLEKMAQVNLTDKPFFLPGLVYGYVGNDPTNLIDPDGLAKGKGAKGKGKIGVGGRHGQTKKYSEQGAVESNHFPAANSYKDTPYAGTSREHMPAVTMERAAHRKAQSTGSSHRAKEWRKKQRWYLKKKEFHKAMRMDIVDMFKVSKKTDWKALVEGILDSIEYARAIKFLSAPQAVELSDLTETYQ